MSSQDDATKLAKDVQRMAEIMALKEPKDRNIRLCKAQVKLLAAWPDQSHVRKLRDYLRQHEIRIHEVD